MQPPEQRGSPVRVDAGETQDNVDPLELLPSRNELLKTRLEFQRQLLQAGTERFTPIRVSTAGVIYDGHHAVRAAAEAGRTVHVLVVDAVLSPSAKSILDLPVK